MHLPNLKNHAINNFLNGLSSDTSYLPYLYSLVRLPVQFSYFQRIARQLLSLYQFYHLECRRESKIPIIRETEESISISALIRAFFDKRSLCCNYIFFMFFKCSSQAYSLKIILSDCRKGKSGWAISYR
jgi:hypothetical protein